MRFCRSAYGLSALRQEDEHPPPMYLRGGGTFTFMVCNVQFHCDSTPKVSQITVDRQSNGRQVIVITTAVGQFRLPD